jgi:hypothetical protein
MDRYPLLKVSKAGLVRRGGKSPARQIIPWREITRIGTASEEGQPYLCAWLKERNERVRLCPLGPPAFPPIEIRAAILAYCPTINIDPM